MFKLTRLEINKLADSANFNRNTTEKVLRLYSILNFFDESDLGSMIALKGGTAINLFLLDLPRLSVDIDLDFTLPLSREEMLEKRIIIDKTIKDYMADDGYSLSDKSKFVHTLDSYVYSYTTSSGGNDLLKIEINYSDRVHILKTERRESTEKLGKTVFTRKLADDELIGSKINALLVRTTPRDVFDVYSLYKCEKIANEDLIRKIAIFYVCLGSEIPVDFEFLKESAINKINGLTFQKIKETLLPVLHKSVAFDVKEMSNFVSNKIDSLFTLDKNDILFIQEYNEKRFTPSVLFSGFDIENINEHPMGLWKTK